MKKTCDVRIKGLLLNMDRTREVEGCLVTCYNHLLILVDLPRPDYNSLPFRFYLISSLKNNKLAKTDPKSYHPLAILALPLVIYERVPYNGLEPMIDIRLPDFTYSYRNKLGCGMAILRLKQALHQRGSIAAFLDIWDAFGSVIWNKLYAIMAKHNIDDRYNLYDRSDL